MRKTPARLSFGEIQIGLLVAALALAGCDDDDTPAPNPGRADAGDAGADAADAGDVAGALAGDAGTIPVFRPERRDFTPARLANLRTKPGFRVAVFATGVTGARMLARGPDGSVYVTTPMTSEVRQLRDTNGDGDVDDPGERTVVASAAETPALMGVHGIAFAQGRVFLASIKNVVGAQVSGTGSFSGFQTLVSDLPDGGQHPNRTLAVGPDGLLYVSVGSDCNACAETNPEHATMLRLNLDGTPVANPANPQHPMLARNPMAKISPRVFASGLRNTLGFDWHPVTKELWGFDQGSDGLGADLPPEELNRLTAGKSYGWPYCWGARQVDPVMDDPSEMLKKSAYCPATEPSLAGVPAHSSPIGFLFYTGDQFPAEYRNDAFLVLRGSWGRPMPVGYKLVRVHFANGQPAALPGGTGITEDFVSGFLIEDGNAHFGRIAGLTMDTSGALLLSDDSNGMIYRISHAAGPGADASATDGAFNDGGPDANPDAP